MVNYCTNEEILDKVGVTTSEINTNTLNRIAKEATAEVDRIIKTTCNPKINIEIINGNDKSQVYLRKLPVLTIKNVKVGDINIDLEDVRFNKSGNVTLLNTADKNYFNSSTSPNVAIKYFYGWLEEGDYETIQDDVVSGDDIVIELGNVENLYTNNWVRIVGLDGFEEWTKIKSVDKVNKTITCDIVYYHEAESIVVKGEIPDIIVKLASVIGGIMGALNMIGSTYTFATSYSVPDHSVTKGVPYPHFAKVLDDLTKQRDEILKNLIPYPTFA